jgi:hypothetical protein
VNREQRTPNAQLIQLIVAQGGEQNGKCVQHSTQENSLFPVVERKSFVNPRHSDYHYNTLQKITNSNPSSKNFLLTVCIKVVSRHTNHKTPPISFAVHEQAFADCFRNRYYP